MLRCSDGSYYTGHTDNLEARIGMHMSGRIKGYTESRLPVKLVYSEIFPTRDEAFMVERKIKGWNRKKKEALIKGDWEEIAKLSRKKR